MDLKIENSIRQKHLALSEDYIEVTKEVQRLVKDTCEDNGWVFLDRTKTEKSFALKVLDGRYSSYQLDDFYACTIVVPTLNSIESALSLINSSFRVDDTKPGKEIHSRPTEFSFDSTRLYCRLLSSSKALYYHDLQFEVQVKTLLEHAWSKATHDFSYKTSDVSWAKERLSAQIKAILDNVDLSILEMDILSKSNVLDKNNPKYERLISILELLNSEFQIQNDKRLAEHIGNLMCRLGVDLECVKICLQKEADLMRGKHTKNLSIYSIVFLSLINQYQIPTLAALKKRKKRKYQANIVIPAEVITESGIDTTKFKDVNILN